MKPLKKLVPFKNLYSKVGYDMNHRALPILVLTAFLTIASMSAQQELIEPDEVTAVGGVVSDTLTMAIDSIDIGDRTITSRLYNGKSPGPTWRLQRGELLRVLVRNRMPVNPDQDSADQGNFPQRINTTNLHVHGLNVSPSDSSDNVLLSILPGTDFQFHIQLPNYHACGTYWYHPHHHTSTYGQVVSGLAGTIIIDDVDDPQITDPALLAIEDRVFIFSSFRYDETTNTMPYPSRLSAATKFNPIAGVDSPVLVNGMMEAKVTFRPGEIQRWRLINATYEMNVDLRWFRIDGDTSVVVHQDIARDGLYFERAIPVSQVLVVTGSREDILVTAPSEPGRYVVEMITRDRQLGELATRDLITMVVAGDPIIPPMSMPTRYPEPIVGGTVRDEEITGHRDVTFTVDLATVGTDPTAVTRGFKINNAPFNHDVVNMTVEAGDVEEWTITNASDDFHPFHIHVNEFQVIEKNGVKLDPPVWHDVLLLDTMSTYKIRHRFGEHHGKTVMHCHYLPHEDWGMMNIIDILPKSLSVDDRPWETPLAYPNPIVGRIDRVSVRIPEFLNGRTVVITVHDIAGTQVASQTVNAAAFVTTSAERVASIDVSTLTAGTYYLRVDGGGRYRETDMLVLVR